MIISTDAEKAFNKIQHPFMIKNSPESRHRRNIPQHNKSHIQQTQSKHYSQWQKTESISCEIRNKTRVPTLNTTIQKFWKSQPQQWRRQWHPTLVSCLENPMDGGAWQAAVHGVTNSRSRLSNFTFTFHFHALEKEMVTHSSVLAWRIPGMGEPGELPSMGSHRVGHD